MTFKEKKELLCLIDEYYWCKKDKRDKGDTLDIWKFEDFSQLFIQNYPSLFADDGIECYWKGTYICIPNFDYVLNFIGLSEEEIHEMF